MVADERKIRDTVQAFLEQSRYALLTAGSGQRALDVAARLKPDLVVLDLMLPDLPGEDVARSLRAISQVADHHAHRQGRRDRPGRGPEAGRR